MTLNWNFQWGGCSNETIACHVESMDIVWSNTIQVYHGEYENFSVNLNKTLTSTGKFRPFNEFSARHAQEKWYLHCTV